MDLVNGIKSASTTDALSSLRNNVGGINKHSFNDDGQRNQALLEAYALVSRLETPWETVLRIAMSQPAVGASLKILRDLRLLEIWQHRGPQTSKTLADWTLCDELLMGRILRHLVANNLLEENEEGMFSQTDFSLACIDPVFGEWITYLYDATLPCFSHLPQYLAKTGYTNPSNPTDGVFQSVKSSKGDLFDYYETHPREHKTFNYIMGGVMARQASWLDIFPHERLVADSGNHESAIVVDVGGNVGRDLERFRAAHPELASRLVLQDRPEVVRYSICPDPIRKIGHDFFTPQSEIGARAYYMHGVIHDWSDEPARRILEGVRAAMKPGFSTLLIHDHVISESHPHPAATAYDLTMMVKVAALERSDSMWRRLLDSAGLKIVKIWDSPLATQSIIEAEVK